MSDLKIRRSSERGHVNFGWLDSFHTFSFGEYFDPAHVHFRALRVINDDRIEAGGGFGTHPHRDMEILSYVVEGELTHRDSMGNGEVIHAGEFQRMTAGTGVEHSEFNRSDRARCRLLQIWIIPEAKGLSPGYEQAAFPREGRINRLRLVAARAPRDGAVTIHQDVEIHIIALDRGRVSFTLRPNRHAWIQVVAGEITVNSVSLKEGDAASTSLAGTLDIASDSIGEALIFDLG